ncbi:BRISC and BRCA1-A complex member 1-like [Cloeon dipterum]|uniref:BRISC and BRCA1-A complex member 1-like n=1 Tax=Cloeon dipterum TaxID=197152 RepID=UPI00321FDB98
MDERKSEASDQQSVVNDSDDTSMSESNNYGNLENEEEELDKKSNIQENSNILLPRMNVQEKIIICLDLCADLHGSDPFRFGDGTKLSTLNMLKRIVQMFLFCKMTIDTKHEYALMALHREGASWITHFTDTPSDITNTMATLKSMPQPPECDMSCVFDKIVDIIALPHVSDVSVELPSHIYRVIMLYARTNCRPILGTNCGSAKALSLSPYFFFDLIYVHEPLNDINKDTCQSIFNDLCTELCLPTSYVFNVGRNPTKLHDCMAKLLAHPLQRPLQEDADYKLLPEEHSN